ncbi:inx-3 [Pristionchus pacificus]|uniref:Innexin n=1 Tax=Pristionchus pacificus TaxID=54126 RepID=A0A2A6BD98_PRIPA|nr:inx-3 [Pristionchus pacificus]|eukprot:PDM63844.1 inx-3 [Pristionchus pacificus]
MLGVPFLERAISSWIRPHSLDDPVDRLNYFVTTMILLFFGIMVSAKQYVGSPIQCWAPMEFRGGWEQYAEDYCFIQNTFYIPFEQEIPTDVQDRQDAEIGYYQWVPIVLALQAIMFYVPNWLWKTLNKLNGVDVENAVVEASKMRGLAGESRRIEAEKLAEYLADAIDMKGGVGRSKDYRILCFRFGNSLGSYVSVLYLFTKMLGDLFNGREWHESGMFPRVTLCDFAVRKLANMHRYTVQCVLMINMFNEKIYLFLWFWFLLVLSVTFINFFYCFSQMIFTRSRINSCKYWLATLFPDGVMPRDEMMLSRFAISGLQPDGILVLRFIEGHAGSLPAKELAIALFKRFVTMQNKQHLPISTQSTSPGFEAPHEFNEKESFLEAGSPHDLYNPDKAAIMQPDYKH